MSSPAGWYPQPDGQQRYWDGELWTDHFAPGVPSAMSPLPKSTKRHFIASTGRRFGVAKSFGWGGLVLVVLIGAMSSGFSGAAIMLGLFAFVVGVIALARGRVGWARLGSRAAGGAVLAAALVAMTIGGATAPPSTSSDSITTASDVRTTTDAAAKAADEAGAATKAAQEAAATKAGAASKASTAVSTPSKTAPAVPAASSPSPTHQSGGITVNAAGAVLPNHARTPGAINPSVTQASIGRTICVSGWTATIRPSSSYTTGLKVEQLASGYTYKGDTATRDYEEDHLISLELGGAPSAEANLWPEPYNSPEGLGSRTRWRTSSMP